MAPLSTKPTMVAAKKKGSEEEEEEEEEEGDQKLKEIANEHEGHRMIGSGLLDVFLRLGFLKVVFE